MSFSNVNPLNVAGHYNPGSSSTSLNSESASSGDLTASCSSDAFYDLALVRSENIAHSLREKIDLSDEELDDVVLCGYFNHARSLYQNVKGMQDVYQSCPNPMIGQRVKAMQEEALLAQANLEAYLLEKRNARVAPQPIAFRDQFETSGRYEPPVLRGSPRREADHREEVPVTNPLVSGAGNAELLRPLGENKTAKQEVGRKETSKHARRENKKGERVATAARSKENTGGPTKKSRDKKTSYGPKSDSVTNALVQSLRDQQDQTAAAEQALKELKEEAQAKLKEEEDLEKQRVKSFQLLERTGFFGAAEALEYRTMCGGPAHKDPLASAFSLLPPHPESVRRLKVCGFPLVDQVANKNYRSACFSPSDASDAFRIGTFVTGILATLSSLPLVLACGMGVGCVATAAGAVSLGVNKWGIKWSEWAAPCEYERMALCWDAVDLQPLDDTMRTVYADAKPMKRSGNLVRVDFTYCVAYDRPGDCPTTPVPEAMLYGGSEVFVQKISDRVWIHDDLLVELLQRFRDNTESLSQRFERMENDLVRVGASFGVPAYDTYDVLGGTLIIAKLILKYRAYKNVLARVNLRDPRPSF
jgi:hypothetical protein